MKFFVTPNAKGEYCTANGKTVSMVTVNAGKDYESEAAAAADLKLTPRALYFAKQTKLQVLQSKAQEPVTVGDLKIRSDADSQAQFTSLATLLQLARDAQPNDTAKTALLAAPLSSVTGPIIDAAGATHDMTIEQTFAFILAYGQAIGIARALLLTKQAQVRAAADLATLAAL